MARCNVLMQAKPVEYNVVRELYLGPEEAQFLVDLLARVGGDPKNTRRVYADSISAALMLSGLNNQTAESKKMKGEVYCLEPGESNE